MLTTRHSIALTQTQSAEHVVRAGMHFCWRQAAQSAPLAPASGRTIAASHGTVGSASAAASSPLWPESGTIIDASSPPPPNGGGLDDELHAKTAMAAVLSTA